MLQLALTSLWQPRASVAIVLRTPFSDGILARAAIVLACLSGIIDPVAGLLFNNGAPPSLAQSPFVVALIQLGAIFLTAVVAYKGGQLFGGTGDFNNSLKVSVWYGVVSIVPSIVILMMQSSGSGLAPTVQFLILIWMMFVLSSFVMVLHNFPSLFLTSLGVIGASLVVGMGTLLLLSGLGLTPGSL